MAIVAKNDHYLPTFLATTVSYLSLIFLSGRDHGNWETLEKLNLVYIERPQTMKGIRYTTEEKIRMLRQIDEGSL